MSPAASWITSIPWTAASRSRTPTPPPVVRAAKASALESRPLAAPPPGSPFMIDYFALLHEPRRPWLDPDLLKQKFISLSAEVHPDRVHLAGEAEKHAAQQR